MRSLFALMILLQLPSLLAGKEPIHFGNLNEQQVTLLLQHQVTRTWSKDLLSHFPSDQAGGKSVVVPVALFPVPANIRNQDKFNTIAFERWCKDHVTTSRSREHGIDAGLAQLFGTESTAETLALTERLGQCAMSNRLGLVLRLSAVGVLANQDSRAVRDAMLTFVLAYANSQGRFQEILIAPSPDETSGDVEAFKVAEVADELLALLKEVPETEVIADYISFLLSVETGKDARVLLANISRADFAPPFLTRQGSNDRHYCFSVNRVPLFDQLAKKTPPLSPASVRVSESRVLESYRSNVSRDNAGTVIYTASRFEMARFSNNVAETCMSSLEDGTTLPEQFKTQLDLLVSRFLQCDDVSVVMPMLRLNHTVDQDVASAESEAEEIRTSAIRLAKGVLTELTAQPEEAFGVSLTCLFDSLKDLRERADAWETYLLGSQKNSR